MSLGVTRNRDMVWLRPLETCLGRKHRQPRPVLNAIQSLFLKCRHQLPVPQESRRRIAVERVKSQNDHFRFKPPTSRTTGTIEAAASSCAGCSEVYWSNFLIGVSSR